MPCMSALKLLLMALPLLLGIVVSEIGPSTFEKVDWEHILDLTYHSIRPASAVRLTKEPQQ